MALLACCADGNFTSSSTWAVVDTTDTAGTDATYLDAQTTGATLSTLESNNRASSGFTPGAITIDGIGVKIAARVASPTGTFTIRLWNLTDAVGVTGTDVTVNASDIVFVASSATLEGGWAFFKFAAPVTLTAAKAYAVSPVNSVSVQISLFNDGTTSNWARFLRTTTTAAPAAGDNMIITREYTAAGASTTRTVTMNETATTDYGSAPTAANSLLTPGVSISTGGTLTYGTVAATNYYLKISNSVIIYSGGTLNIGTTGTPMPRDSSGVLELDPAADGDYGVVCRSGSSVNFQGLSRTSGKDIVSCKLNTDEAVNSTSLGVDTDTGWLDNDEIAIASTSRVQNDCEFNRLNGAAGASTLTVDGGGGTGGGLAFAHSGTSPTQAEVILLTRNVRFRSATSTLMTYIQVLDGATFDADWAEFYYMGEAVVGKRGIEWTALGTGVMNISVQYSCIHDCEDGGFYIPTFSGTITNLIYSNNVSWNNGLTFAAHVTLASTITATNWTIDNNIAIKSVTGTGFSLTDVGGVFTNNTAVGCINAGILFNENNGVTGTISNLTSHSNGGVNFSVGNLVWPSTISDCISWRSNSAGMNGSAYCLFDGYTTFGNAADNINPTASAQWHFKDLVSNGDTSFATTTGIRCQPFGAPQVITLDNCDFSTVSGIKTAHTQDINCANSPGSNSYYLLRNTKLGAATEVSNQASLNEASFVKSSAHDQVAGNQKTWLRGGTLTNDSTIFNTAAPSLRMTPISASVKCQSAPPPDGMLAAVASGATVTIAVSVRKSVSGDGAAYNGAEPRLLVRGSAVTGITTTTVLDTAAAAAGSWEVLSGTTAAVTQDCVLEFYVDCDGTTGWVNVDDWEVN